MPLIMSKHDINNYSSMKSKQFSCVALQHRANLLVYARDKSNPVKQQQAKKWLTAIAFPDCMNLRCATLSTKTNQS